MDWTIDDALHSRFIQWKIKETAAILTRDIFWFFMSDEFIATTINEGNTDLAQYPAAKV